MACYVLTFDGIADKIRIPSSSDTFNFETFSKDLQALAEQEKFELTELKQEAVTMAKMPTSEDVLFYSGGAVGADTFWGQIAKEYGYNTRHIYAPEYDSWSPEKRAEIDKQYDDATNKLGRWKKASTTYEGKLMRRGMEQANLADSIFAIGTINSDQYRVDGGTAYAVVRGIERNIPIYLYDLLNKRWKTYDANKGIFVPYDQTPLLTPHAALIGSRMKEQPEYQQEAKAVIRQVFEKFVSEKSYLQKASSTNQGGNVKPKTINVWFSTNENADLSNFASRPFKYQGKSFGNVETAFQLSKLDYASSLEQQPTDVQNWANGNLQSSTASDSRKFGRKIVGLRTSEWDANSSRIMEEIIRTSLEQNPNILQKLKATGDAIITHTQGDAPWNTEFPRILMKIRDEVRVPESITKQLVEHLQTSGIKVLGRADIVEYFKTGTPDDIQAAWEKKRERDASTLTKERLKEMDTIRQKAIANDTFMKAPNGKPTNLTERQWLQVRTTNFKNWFGDWKNDPANASKIVDENGEPLVVYHGGDSGIRVFDRSKTKTASEGFFFTVDKNVAKGYGNVTEVFLNIKNLLENDSEWFEGIGPVSSNNPYDGEQYFHKDAEAFIVWNPNQIKSATDNNGNFSLTDNDIQTFTTPEGEVYGFVDKDGNIYLDETVISPEHPIHEYTHLWDRVVQEKNPALWQRGIQLLQQTSLWYEILNDEKYGKKWQNTGITGDELINLVASEVHARLVGPGAAEMFERIAREKGDQNFIQKLKSWILDVWKNLKATFGEWSSNELEHLTLKDFDHMVVRDFADGVIYKSKQSTEPSTTTMLDTSHDLVITATSNVSAIAKQMRGIDTLRHPDANGMHFGNPFSHANYSGVQKVFPTVKEAVIAFEQWLRGENYQDIEPERREWIVQQINSGALVGKPLVYYTDRVPDDSYGRSTYDYNAAPNHAHILMKLIQEHVHPEQKATSQVIRQEGHGAIDDSINALENNTLLSDQEKKSVKSLIGDKTPKVVMASEHSDPVFHAKKIKELVEAELAKPIQDRSFHMMQIMTKHDGLPLRELAKLPIPKLFHFSITSLGGTPYEPGVMKMDHLLDRIGALINDGTLNPSLITIRIDPIIPGVTKKEDIRHIVERGLAMGIKQYKFSVMDSYGYTSTGERCETEKDRYIIKRMQELGYDWDTYYGRQADGTVNFNAKPEYINDIFHYMDDLADELHFFINTCGEDIKRISGLKHIKAVGCLNVAAMNAAMGTNDIVHVDNGQRSTCSCYGGKVDALRYDDHCASSCLYCYAKHNSDQAMRYYNEDGSLKINRFTEVTEPERLVRIPGIGTKYMVEGYSKTNPSYTFQQWQEDLRALDGLAAQWQETDQEIDFTSYAEGHDNLSYIQRLVAWRNSFEPTETTNKAIEDILKRFYKNGSYPKVLCDLNDNAIVNAVTELFEFSHANPLQLQFNFDSSDSLVKRPVLTQKSPEMQTVKTVSSYSSSETVNKINRYLDAALSLESNEKSISELDTQEAIHVVAQQLDRLGIPTHLIENDTEMEKLGLPANTEAAVKNGEIYVNLQRASVSSPMHEFMHLVFAVMKQTNFDTFVSLMNDLRGITEFDSILQQVQSSEYYNKLIESDQMEEAFVRYLSGLIEGKIDTSDTFETWYNENSQELNKAIQTTFNTPPIVDLLTFLKQPFASLTKYGSELFGQKNNKTEGYSKQKYQVDISGRIMDYIQTNMNSLIQEGECK